MKKEAEDPDVEGNWERCVNFFLKDRERVGGWRNFPYHLIVYLYFRNESYKFNKFIPSKKNEYRLVRNGAPIRSFTHFCHYVLKIKISQHDKAVAKGNVHYFVRALKPKIVDDATVDICREFQVLKRRLKIEW